MAVYERAYRGYAGPRTPARWRFLILPRYAFQDVFRSRVFTAFFAGCFLFPLACAVLIYLRHNVSALALLEFSKSNLFTIDARAALFFMNIQGTFLGFLIALIVGPALVSPDLRNNAMPLYLSRPLSRKEYVAGKMAVLVVLLSLITWIPGLLLFLLQSYLEGAVWFRGNLRMAGAVFVASWIWILLLSLIALAVSASVKWKPLATGALIGIFFVLAGAGQAFGAMFHTPLGELVNLGVVIERIWASLFGVALPVQIPLPAAWASVFVACGVCVALLARKLRAYEVVR